MTTAILFTHDGGIPVPSVSSVAVAHGDSFVVSVAEDGKAVLYFSPELAAVVSPAPGTSVELGKGGSVEFTFLSSEEGAYSIVAAREGDGAPTHFQSEPSGHVKIGSIFHAAAEGFPISGGGTRSGN